MRVESCAGPDGLAVTYTRTPTASPSPWTPTEPTDGAAMVPCVFPGGRSATARFVHGPTGASLFVWLEFNGTRHEVLVTAPAGVAGTAVWAALALVPPVCGWRVPAADLAAIGQADLGRSTSRPELAESTERWLDDPGFVAAIERMAGGAVTVVWLEQGLRSVWMVSTDSTASELTVSSRVDAGHVDIWTTSPAGLVAAIEQRLDRCEGTVALDDRVWRSGEPLDDLLVGALATGSRAPRPA